MMDTPTMEPLLEEGLKRIAAMPKMISEWHEGSDSAQFVLEGWLAFTTFLHGLAVFIVG